MAITVLNDTSTDLQKNLDELTLPTESMVSVGDIRVAYAEQLNVAPFFDKTRASYILKADVTKPIFKNYKFHPDDLPKRNNMVEITSDTAVEISSIDADIMRSANKYATLISNTIERFNNVKHRLAVAEERIRDIDFINSSYKGLTQPILITSENMSGGYCFIQDVFSAFASVNKEVDLLVVSVSGNGYVGNKYVLTENEEFLSETENKEDVTALIDNNPMSTFEYSRINSSALSSIQIDDVNSDNQNVTCTILVTTSDEGINTLRLTSGIGKTKDIAITDVSVSQDGINYKKNKLGISSFKDEVCILSFPTSKYVKITLVSSYNNIKEKLGYEHLIDNENKKIIPIQDAIRKFISLSDVKGYLASYTSSTMISNDLAPTDGCKIAGIFANEYLPETTEEELIRYEFIINGKEYTIKPINSLDAGIKLITSSSDRYNEAGVVFLNENIKTLQLRVTINAINPTETPFIGNLKVYIG